ncbi:FtsX-like permease family protein [Paenibacillus radicis (ex Gao et al. 2016)]|uniref:ABC transporter permease n=1 Tax=Paenibacillus radicis (ex Gao et al. 2016) TaxID=1737354 RepID=A0A917LSH7_9BACL|nr:ABC transporter permease [Paenibacillus radicis (ex Gao et al. 2016)]GGG53934.1 ABC transporter permease [Paenibacillus radicis (ex Gao et al. 2016)]
MTFRQFAFRNVSRNKRLYAGYFLSSLFTVMAFFTFSIFAYHPVLSGVDSSSVTFALSVSKWIIYVFSFFFVLYSMSSFLQSRKREFGLMMMQGMTTVQLRLMIFLENMMIGLSATIGGIALGLVFAKVILLTGENFLAVNEKLAFYFPYKAIVLTLLSFLLLFILISFFISAVLQSGKLITLLNGDKQAKSEPKSSVLLVWLVPILLGTSYFLSLRAEGLEALLLLVPVVVMVCIGTYLLFTQLSVYTIRKLKRMESIFWLKTNMLLFSDLAYRMKDNARSFFLVAIISTVSFCSIGSLYGFQSMIGGHNVKDNPYLFTYTTTNGYSDEQKNIEQIDRSLKEANVTTEKAFLNLAYYKASNRDATIAVVRLSDYNRMTELMEMKGIVLSDGKAAVVDFGLSRIGQSMLNQPITLQPDVVIEANKAVVSPAVHGINGYFVISDDQYAKLGASVQEKHYYIWHGPLGQKQSITAGGKLSNALPYSDSYEFFALEFQNSVLDKLFGPILFIGLFIGIVFFVSAGSFLYFRLYSDLDDDRRKFKAVSKMGLSEKELTKILNRQMVLLFFAPIVVALVHGAVALTTLSHMFQYSLLKESVLVLGLFFIVQVIYFFIVRFFYIRQVKLAIV